jgi:hypothetical protein
MLMSLMMRYAGDCRVEIREEQLSNFHTAILTAHRLTNFTTCHRSQLFALSRAKERENSRDEDDLRMMNDTGRG